MYAILLELIVLFVWIAFLTRTFINLRRNREVKENTQLFHEQKLDNIKKELYVLRKETEETQDRETKTSPEA